MKNLQQLVKQTQKLATDNSPAILTAIGVTGVVTTAYLTGKASFKAGLLIRNEEEQVYERMPNKMRFDLVWKLYIPAAGVGAFTITSIVMANRIGMRRTAAMAAAYSLSERAYNEYKDKVVEHIGQNKEQKVRDEIAQDRVTKNPPTDGAILITSGGNVLCMDAHSGRYFESDMETLKKAQNDTNHEIINQGYASLSDFYNRIGLANTKFSDDVGWSSDKLLELSFSTTISDDQRPCIVVDFFAAPIPNFFRTH